MRAPDALRWRCSGRWRMKIAYPSAQLRSRHSDRSDQPADAALPVCDRSPPARPKARYKGKSRNGRSGWCNPSLHDMEFLSDPTAAAASPVNAMAPAQPLPRLLTTAEMCVTFHCCSKTVGRLAKAKGLHVSKIGSRKFYRLSEIEALLGLSGPAAEE